MSRVFCGAKRRGIAAILAARGRLDLFHRAGLSAMKPAVQFACGGQKPLKSCKLARCSGMGDLAQPFSTYEIMVTAASRMLRDGDVIFVGIGIPNVAVNLARRTRCPNLVLIYESGAIGAQPERLPISIGDPALVTGALGVCSMPEVFQYYLQRGLIDVGFLGGAQIDRFGNINTTVIGDYAKPKVRLPGSGGACEIAALARRTLLVMPHKRRAFPERVDFCTSPGYLGGGDERANLRVPGGGPQAVITDLGVLRFSDDTREMVLESLHPGASVEHVRAETGWPLRIADSLGETEPPNTDELRILRELKGAS